MSNAYMDPQPPEMSWTSSFVGCRADLILEKMADSAGSRYSGAVTSAASFEGEVEEKVLLVRDVRDVVGDEMNAARVVVAGVENLEGARESWRNVLEAILDAIGFLLLCW